MIERNQTSQALIPGEPLDYLVVGHITADMTEEGITLGGTASFSGLTANMLGLKTGMMTSFSPDLDISQLNQLRIINKSSPSTTTFKNISDGINRTQFLFQKAEQITKGDLRKFAFSPKILHLGPVAGEVDPEILFDFPGSLKCLTPQGWFRKTNPDGKVVLQKWGDFEKFLPLADIAVISHEDVKNDEDQIAKMAALIPIFVVTENFKGARIYWHNDARFIHAPEVKYVSDTGAGDIFAAAFFYRFYFTKDPYEAGRFAVLLASWSVTRKQLESIPTLGEIKTAKMELLGQ